MPDTDNDSDKALSMNKGTGSQRSVNPRYAFKKEKLKSVQEYVDGIKTGNRTILSQAITLVESSNIHHKELAREILDACIAQTGRSIRIGITGVPGVGKSTFIEALGRYILQNDRKLAVLTIDPSSSRSKGSILGDKTRMPHLSTQKNAFIRPSPTSGALGGIAHASRETMLLCEAAGFDTIFIETVGVGQSEINAHAMVDFFLLLMLSGAGDELQGIKRGIMEMADLIAINKAEEENLQAAEQARREYENALSLFPPSPSGWKPPVVTCSALKNSGIDNIWAEIESYLKLTKKNGYFERRRREQASFWMYETIHQRLQDRFYSHPEVARQLLQTESRVRSGKISSYKAANELLELFETEPGDG